MAKDIIMPTEGGALALPEDMTSFLEENAGGGFENITASDLAIPYFGILQALSPQVKKGEQRVLGAEEGDIFQTVTTEVIKPDVGIRVIPAAYQKKIVEWVPRSAGGGFVGYHEFDQDWLAKCQKNERNKPITDIGNDLVETAYFFIIRILPDGGTEKGLIAMTSTQLKKARAWNAVRMNFRTTLPNGKAINPPAYAQIHTLSTKQESKADQTWFGWDFPAPPELVTDRALAQMAKDFATDVLGGRVEVKPVRDEDHEADPGVF